MIVNCLFFYTTFSLNPIFKSICTVFPHILSRLYTLNAVESHPPNNTLFFKVVFLISVKDFEKLFKQNRAAVLGNIIDAGLLSVISSIIFFKIKNHFMNIFSATLSCIFTSQKKPFDAA